MFERRAVNCCTIVIMQKPKFVIIIVVQRQISLKNNSIIFTTSWRADFTRILTKTEDEVISITHIAHYIGVIDFIGTFNN